MEARLLTVARYQGGVFTAADANRVDVGGPALRRLVRHGTVVRIRRGAYVLREAWSDASPEVRLALRARAVLRNRPGDAASHQSALALHGLPLHQVETDVVDLVSDVSRTRLSSGLRTHPPGAPLTTVHGHPAVTIPHAIGQVLARSGVAAALVPLDAATHAGACTLESVAAALGDRATTMIESADPACESVGETRTRLLLRDLGHHPRTQVAIRDHGFLARVDFLIDHVVVEFDGLVKYGDAAGRTALAREKYREDRLRSLGYGVVRLTWADLDHPQRVGSLLRRALHQTRHGPEIAR